MGGDDQVNNELIAIYYGMIETPMCLPLQNLLDQIFFRGMTKVF